MSEVDEDHGHVICILLFDFTFLIFLAFDWTS